MTHQQAIANSQDWRNRATVAHDNGFCLGVAASRYHRALAANARARAAHNARTATYMLTLRSQAYSAMRNSDL